MLMDSETIIRPSRRLDEVGFSPIRKSVERAAALAREGRHIVHLDIGESDFDTSMAIVEPVVKALVEKKMTHYSHNRGLESLRKSVARRYQDRYGMTVNPETEIVLTMGAAESIFDSIMAYVDPGDEVLVLAPHFVNYEAAIHMAGGTYVNVDLRQEDGYQVNEKILRAAVTPKSKIIMISNPSNPTGTVLTAESLEIIAQIAIEHNLLVISDEIYDNLVYGDVPFHTMAMIPRMRERCIIINGFSKTYAMTGWRVGYVICPETLNLPILKIHQYNTSCSPTFIHQGLAEGMLTPEALRDADAMANAFKVRWKLARQLLDQIKTLRYAGADGGFYVLVDVSGTGLTGTEFSRRLLEEKGVATVPGVSFGKNYDDYIRVSYVASENDVAEGLDKMKAFVEELMA